MFNWLEFLIDKFVYAFLSLQKGSHFAEALHFFFYDTTKILLLLVIIVSLMGIINFYFPVEKVRNFLSSKKLYGLEYLIASLFGVVTPFCSCSSVPLFIGFVKGGIPLGVTFAFLITSPLVNEVAIGLFIGVFGIKITLLYVISGILLGTISGFILQKLRLEEYLMPWVKEILNKSTKETTNFEADRSLKSNLPIIKREVSETLRKVFPYVVLGIGVGAIIHGWVPNDFFKEYISKENIFAVPLSVILAAPIYVNASGIIPVAEVLVAKGIPLGTTIAFIMGAVGLSFPEALLLKKVMTLKLLAIFFVTVVICIIISGYFYNFIIL